MADDFFDIRLLGFADFEASRRFLCTLDNEIWLSRWSKGGTEITVDRPVELTTGGKMRAELEKPSRITVISAHGYWGHDGFGFCGKDENTTLLLADKIENIGAQSMLLIDACRTPILAELINNSAAPRCLIVGLERAPGEEKVTQETAGSDSVTVIAAVIRELCYPKNKDLYRPAVERAIKRVNAQVEAYNRGASVEEKRPKIYVYPEPDPL